LREPIIEGLVPTEKPMNLNGEKPGWDDARLMLLMSYISLSRSAPHIPCYVFALWSSLFLLFLLFHLFSHFHPLS
jgi:hypothetical protein